MSPWIQERKVQGKHKGLLLFAKLFEGEAELLITYSSCSFILTSLWCGRKDIRQGNLELSISAVLFQGARSRPCPPPLFTSEINQGGAAQSEYHPLDALYTFIGCRRAPEEAKVRESIVLPMRESPPPGPPDNSKYQKRPQTQTEREKPRWTFPALKQPAIDFLHRSLNGCYSPICNSNEFHYKALEHTQRWRCWPTAMRRGREKRRERGCHSGLCLSVVTTHLPAGWRLKITAEQL